MRRCDFKMCGMSASLQCPIFCRFRDSLPLNFDDSLHLDIIKEALLRAIHDIDVTFTKV